MVLRNTLISCINHNPKYLVVKTLKVITETPPTVVWWFAGKLNCDPNIVLLH